VASTPSSQDLEMAARALAVLRRRGRSQWSLAEFVSVARARATDHAQPLLAFLEACDLVEAIAGEWRLTPVGTAAIDSVAGADWGPYGRAALATGAYDSEMTRLIEVGQETGGALTCPLVALRRVAPRAGALLAWDPRMREGDRLVVPLDVLDSLLARAAMDQAATLPQWVEDQGSVGWRAELYSLRFERSRFGSKRVLHISKDAGDGFGYDIETMSSEPSRYIEVKGSRSTRVSFVLTARELAVAREHPHRYELHFWGAISLLRAPAEEYGALREQGYPEVIQHPAAAIEGDAWTVEAQSWRATRAADP
jgi:hypothetical protein